MKRYFIIFISASLFIACSQKLIDKPEHLLSEKEMENILYDVSIINATKGVSFNVFENNNIMPTQIITEKYGVDSLSFAESSVYYASAEPDKYIALFERVKTKLEAERKVIEQKNKLELNDKNESTPKLDSIQPAKVTLDLNTKERKLEVNN